MKRQEGKLLFGPWLPDLADLDNPGVTEAQNVLFYDGAYKPYRPLLTSGDALASRPMGAIHAETGGGTPFLYAGLTQSLQRQNVTLGTWTNVSSAAYSASTTSWSFTQFENLVIATNYHNDPECQSVGSGNFVALATSGAAPRARRVGRIGRFVFLGDTQADATPYRVQWCAIDNPRDWPIPGTADAVSKQAGEQLLNAQWGPVLAIVGGDQFGLIFQRGGITRVTYIGGTIVFQFDELEEAAGLYFPSGVVRFGGKWAYISETGFQVTDGVNSVAIGAEVIDRYFWDSYIQDNRERVCGAVDLQRKLIFWGYPTAALGGGVPDRIIAWNFRANRFTRADQNHERLITVQNGQDASVTSVKAFGTDFKIGSFTGSVGTATITSSEAEFTIARRTTVQGVKPLITGASAVTKTVALGYRDTLDSAVTYTSETAPNSRTGFADILKDAYFHRARTTITGDFQEALGVEFLQTPSGSS